jgi:hypothetical protein
MDENEYVQEFFAFQARTEWVWETYRPEYENLREVYHSVVERATEIKEGIVEKLDLGIIYEDDIDFSYLDESAEAFSNMLGSIDIIFACLDRLHLKLQKAGEEFEGYHPYMVTESFYNHSTAVLIHNSQNVIEDKQFYEGYGYEFHAPNIERLFTKDQINEMTDDRAWINSLFAEYEDKQDTQHQQ